MILRAENLMKSYSGKKVVKDVSLQLKQGEIVGLLGPNGAGKTTSFYMIVGLIKPNSGKIYLSHTKINNIFSIRMPIGNTLSNKRYVLSSWNLIKKTARSI